ncbi:FixH family protein [Hyphococcus sp.]|uniref:FixH family protein n=1 Tax=Hyphococcus sp. TaxID=2038636 RepID=UPI0035C66B63
MPERSEEKGKLTGRHVLIMVLAFFGVMIAANVIFIRAAVESFPGVAEDKSYLEGLKYNDTLAERAAQAELGWTAEVAEVARDGEKGRIVVRLAKDETALSSLAVDGVLKRPASADADQPLAFKALGEGLYEADVVVFAPGAWDMALRAENSLGETLDVEARIIAP